MDKCKYKFQDKEKFNGKPYCTLFGELCEDVFAELGYEICEENCQVYADYIELIKLKQANCNEKFKNQCHCAFRCLENGFCADAENRIKQYKEELETQKQTNIDCEIEYRRVVSQCNELREALLKIKDCATTEMVEIATRTDYNGFLALQGITAKVNQVLKLNEVKKL